jgi:nitrate/TMAO reductase-like tetraheme cytochrome c subunit
MKMLLLLNMILLAIVCFPLVTTGKNNPESCLDCHGNSRKMQESGYPHFFVTQQEVERQTGMTATCSDCHLGNPTAKGKASAHLGMGRLLLVKKNGLKAEVADSKLPLEAANNPVRRLRYMVEKDGRTVVDTSVNTILYQDKRIDTLSQNFDFMKKTCGKCHPREFAEYRNSNMARNAKQSRYKSWTDKEHGPHNCGVWFGDNYTAIASNTAVSFSAQTAALNQRACNICHVGCLDCHLEPQVKDNEDAGSGMHNFIRTPKPENCYGGGRGSLCHAGPEDRRRGAGYFGGYFSHPEGMEPDVHLAARVGCLDCHDSTRNNKKLGHASIKRQATCDKCHASEIKSNAASLHAKLSCEACHIRNVAGYQATFWGPGKLAGKETPYHKYNGYYGVMKDPILIKDQRGRWIPIKPYPMAVLNQKEANFKSGLHWRYPAKLPDLKRTDDAWGYVGLFGGMPENNNSLLWIQMDKMSHKYGKSRSCDSCHFSLDGEQRQELRWGFSDEGAFPFAGRHTVVANQDGLYIRNMKADENIDVSKGYRLSSLAPWVYLKDKWCINGNFALPEIKDRKKYSEMREDTEKARMIGVVHGR